MQRTFLLLWVASLMACDGARASDAGTPIVLPDAGMQPDAGHDAATDGGSDGGSGTCGSTRFDVTSYWPPLPETCLPRCSAETKDAIRACGMNGECGLAALRSDTTPSVMVDTPYGPVEVDCAGDGPRFPCYLWQLYSCDADFCSEEYFAYVECSQTGAPCTPEYTALESCREANPEWDACQLMRTDACYES